MQTPNGTQRLNHHAATILPWYEDRFLLERKGPDPAFYFENALNIFGGSATNEQHRAELQTSPRVTAIREVGEETYLQIATEEGGYTREFGYEVMEDSRAAWTAPPEVSAQMQHDAEKLGRILIGDPEKITYAGSFVARIDPPAMKRRPIQVGFSIYTRPLDTREFEHIQDILTRRNGKVTTDNVKYDGRTEFVARTDMQHERFAWGYDHMLSMLHEDGHPKGVRIRNLETAVAALRMETAGEPTYNDIRALGFTYKGD
ncbi:MAG: hypothetical protein OXR66_08650 [Candidatus Woesearchaeota archaeon]|nr:hypothetical protein [Candidatus Woesearchaeota archaeon]